MRLPGAVVVVPLLLLLAGAFGVAALVVTRPQVERKPPPEVTPLVRVVEARPGPWRYVVHSQGTVQPRTESELIPQVSGVAEWVSPELASGGFFEKGELLVRLEPSDYRVELASAQAAVARAESDFERTRTELERQRALREQGVASQARIDDAENAFRVAEALLREARARLERAESDMARTRLHAPFEGRVRSERVDVGQFLNRGESIATLYAVDFAEVVLPVPDRELRFLDVQLTPVSQGADAMEAQAGPRVELHAEFAGRAHVWTGRVVRTGGEIDARTRMVHLVARVADPYGLHDPEAGAPLAVGLFVQARILGQQAQDVFVLPRAALHSGDPMDPQAPAQVHVVDAQNRLRIRPVRVLRTEAEHVVIASGLEPGERVSLSSLRAVVDGMRVRVADGAGAGEGRS